VARARAGGPWSWSWRRLVAVSVALVVAVVIALWPSLAACLLLGMLIGWRGRLRRDRRRTARRSICASRPARSGPMASRERHDAAPLLDALVASLADAVYFVDADGTIEFVNPAAGELLGYDHARELIGRPSHATTHHHRPDDTRFPEAECPLLRPRTTGEVVRVEHDHFFRRDGSRVPVSYSSAPVDTAHGRGAVVVFRDISGELAREADARRAVADRARSDELQASRARVLAAADAERRRISRNLHDGAQQRLVHIAMQLALAERAATSAPDTAAERVREARDEVLHAMDELRALAAGLHPTVLTTRGLAAAVDDLTPLVALPVVAEIPEQRLPIDVEVALYFLIAEALTNAARHARATAVEIHVGISQDGVQVNVADDGRGGADPTQGTGLLGLEDRFAALGGSLFVDSPRGGGGTRVHGRLPL
jgi:PAS domain S-box-containing protein